MKGKLTTRCLLAAAVVLVLAVLTAPAGAQALREDAPAGQDTQQEAPTEDPCDDVPLWEKPACRAAEGVRQGAATIITAGLTGVFDQLYEWVAGGAAWIMGELVGIIDASTSPDVTAAWFTEQYRLMGSLAALFIMPVLMVATVSGVIRQDWKGLLRAYFVYVPVAMLGTAVAIPLVDMALGITDWASGLFLSVMRGDIEAFVATVTTSLASGGAGTAAAGAASVSPFLMFLAASVIALGAFAVWVELVLRAVGIYLALFFLPLGLAALVWPATSKWLGRLVKALAALILSKFIIVAALGLAAALLGNIAEAGVAGMVAGSAMMLLTAFSPLVLFKFGDVAGDEIASHIEGATQHRTSPVPTPSPQQSASKVYGRIMNGRVARDRAGAGMATGATSVGAGAAAGGAAAAAGVAKATVTAGPRMGRAAGDGLDEMASTNGQKPGKSAPNQTTASPEGSTTARSRPETSRAPQPGGSPPAEGGKGGQAHATVPPPPQEPDRGPSHTPHPAPPARGQPAQGTPPRAVPDPPAAEPRPRSKRPPQPPAPPAAPPTDPTDR